MSGNSRLRFGKEAVSHMKLSLLFEQLYSIILVLKVSRIDTGPQHAS